MELPPPSPSQAPSFSQPTLDANDFVRWGKDSRSSTSGAFAATSGYSSIHVSRTSSSDSSLFPDDSLSDPEQSHSALKRPRPSSLRLRARLADPASRSGRSLDPTPSGSGKPGNPSQPKLLEMLKGVSEALEENTRLKKRRLEKEVRRSRLRARIPTRPHDVAAGRRIPKASGKPTRSVPGGSGKQTVKPSDPEPESVDPSPQQPRRNPASKEVVKIPIEDCMDVDSSVILDDVSMNECPWPQGVDTKSKSPVSDSQSSAKMMPPPPVPLKALKQPTKQASPSKPPPSKVPRQPPPPSPPPTQSNPSRRRTLGMTRTTIQTNVASHSILLVKPKPFKSPLIKQEPGFSQLGGPPRSQSRTYPVPGSSTHSQPVYPTQKPVPAKSTQKPPKPKKSSLLEAVTSGDDPDTSYDFSTSSIDGDELDKLMEEYDRAAR